MSFLQKSGLKKHLSSKAGHSLQSADPFPTVGARVVLRDGNLVTVLSPAEEALQVQEIAKT